MCSLGTVPQTVCKLSVISCASTLGCAQMYLCWSTGQETWGRLANPLATPANRTARVMDLAGSGGEVAWSTLNDSALTGNLANRRGGGVETVAVHGPKCDHVVLVLHAVRVALPFAKPAPMTAMLRRLLAAS